MPPPDETTTTAVSVVVLTMGNRPVELAAAVRSSLDQAGVTIDLIVVANGVPATDIDVSGDDRVTVVETGENLGIPGGRNIGVLRSGAPLIAFLDDDARFLNDDVLARCHEMFVNRPKLGVFAMRIVDENGHTARRHVPRVGARDPGRSGAVTAFLGGAAVIRAVAFDDVGGYAAPFLYSMEETDLALRLIEHGWDIHYDGTPAVFHPATEPSRHPEAAERTMRNRVWLAHRTLPAPLAALYVTDWLALAAFRRPRSAITLAKAVRTGWRTRPGPRSPIRWRTVARLTRLGRPPII